MTQPKFVHLRLHTEYSLHDGLLTINSLLQHAGKDKMPAIAVTDTNNLYATVKFYQKAREAGIKPLIGADVWISPEANSPEPTRLTLLCKNNIGYANLLELISEMYLTGQSQGKPLLKLASLEKKSTGLIVLSGAEEGDVGKALLQNNLNLAEKLLKRWQQVFNNNYYIEISRVGKEAGNDYTQAVLPLAAKLKLPIVATNDARFLSPNDFEAHEARVCIQQGVTLEDPHRKRDYTEQQYLRTQAEMVHLFADLPSALANSVEIAKRCNVNLALGKSFLPYFAVPNAHTTESYLSTVAHNGLDERLNIIFADDASTLSAKKPLYLQRLKLELDVINSMGFAGYFLIVADFVQWAKDNDIPVGPGRGSGPGSLVAYCLKITDLDPIALELLFERFLNPERVSMPDFDIDFCMDGRDKVIDYVIKRHGEAAVAQIITYGTMAAKAVVRDVGRVLGLSYGFVDKIAKLIPFEIGMTLQKALMQEPLLNERFNKEEDVKTLIELALKLEGLTRNVGKHAGGIVIAPGKLTDFVPLYVEDAAGANPVTQFDKDDVEKVGLVKFDFLGLKTLTIIDRALKIINANASSILDITTIALDDEATFKMLKACHSTAVFQLESHGMRDLIKRLQPDCFEDLIALVALFRPGPLQSGMVDDFINRKHGRAKVVYPHPDLEPILSPTYGVILYQEQVMQIAQVLAGYTLGAADILRRAMGKKKPEEMAKQRTIFCQGAVARGVEQSLANNIFDIMEKFAGYGFNKSHSASYALIAYQTAWLKAHYPAAFMAAVLSSDMDRTEKVLILLEDCTTFNIKVAPPDINASYYYFTVVDEKNLRYGLGAIKGVGEAAIENIIQNRNDNGAFQNLFDFCQRVDLRKVNRRVLEALIKSGSFDCFNIHRASLMASLNLALQTAEQATQLSSMGQRDLLGCVSVSAQTTPQYTDSTPWKDEILLQGEKETLGFYLSGHPLNRYQAELKHITNCKLIHLHPSQHANARVAGIITGIRTRQTRRGDRMAICTIDDGSAQIDVVCFADVFNKFRHLLANDQMLLLEGEVSIDDFSNNVRMVARDVMTIAEARQKFVKGITLDINNIQDLTMSFNEILNKARGGSCPLQIRWVQNEIIYKLRLGKQWLIKPNDDFHLQLEQLDVIKSIEFHY